MIQVIYIEVLNDICVIIWLSEEIIVSKAIEKFSTFISTLRLYFSQL